MRFLFRCDLLGSLGTLVFTFVHCGPVNRHSRAVFKRTTHYCNSVLSQSFTASLFKTGYSSALYLFVTQWNRDITLFLGGGMEFLLLSMLANTPAVTSGCMSSWIESQRVNVRSHHCPICNHQCSSVPQEQQFYHTHTPDQHITATIHSSLALTTCCVSYVLRVHHSCQMMQLYVLWLLLHFSQEIFISVPSSVFWKNQKMCVIWILGSILHPEVHFH